jgi:hypothetical protein
VRKKREPIAESPEVRELYAPVPARSEAHSSVTIVALINNPVGPNR